MRIGTGLTIGAALLAAACSSERERTAETTAPAPAAKASLPPPAASAAPAPPPARPAGAEAIDAALSGVKAFNAKAAEDLAAIARDERRIRDAAGRAAEATRSLTGSAAGQRQSLANRIAAARTEAEAAHKGLSAGLSTFQAISAAQAVAVDAAVAQCASNPELTAYEGCTALSSEQALMKQNVDAVTARFDAAENVWRQSRPQLDEASATLALGATG